MRSERVNHGCARLTRDDPLEGGGGRNGIGFSDPTPELPDLGADAFLRP